MSCEWDAGKTGRLTFTEVGAAVWLPWGDVFLWTWGLTMFLSLAFLIVDPPKNKKGKTRGKNLVSPLGG